MINHSSISKAQIFKLIKSNKIQLAGNRKLKIYGTLQCKSGKRMMEKNRVFFISKTEAEEQGYRPCAHCMKEFYELWKHGSL
ncbi:Ada metal-binding domain-containing protein [Fulvivirga sediminis]|uniref:Metal-binding protein n=1 Tax=Fulvivirga sediminis TaxID=2803949 RepID=A0A937F7Q0_9BACT|nr:Ada metal-binding domain-containing protein [Fulvivirga sediminis]MBL3655518.1 metal-binding protein [Fulvivirga sediminis]